MILIANKYEVPDNCPGNFALKDDLMQFGQSSVCCRCPVFCCGGNDADLRLIEPEGYREDWAAEWAEFFKTNDPACLTLKLKKKE